MAKFTKTILKVGKYRSLDGEVNVTPARLRHWVDQFKKFSAAGNVVPVAFDHASDAAGLTPLSINEFRSAENTVGRLSDLRLSNDGHAAEMTLELSDPKAVKLAKSNDVFVSPVLGNRWRDGSGNKYRDLWTHVDIVNHPVDASQSPFTALSAATQFWRFALDEDEDQLDEMAGEMNDAGDDMDAGMDDAAMDMDAAPPEADPAPMDDMPDPMDEAGGDISEVLADLLQVGIVLGDDTTEMNFMDRLIPALKTYIANQDTGGDMSPGDDDLYKDEPVQVEQQQFQQMSLQQRKVHEYAQTKHREEIRSRLNKLFVQGRCTRKELEDQRSATEIVRLSLNSSGSPAKSDVERWIDSREAVPKGTFWSKKVRTQRMSVQVEKPPITDSGQMTEEKAERVAKRLLGRK